MRSGCSSRSSPRYRSLKSPSPFAPILPPNNPSESIPSSKSWNAPGPFEPTRAPRPSQAIPYVRPNLVVFAKPPEKVVTLLGEARQPVFFKNTQRHAVCNNWRLA
jgi:hypothetical protein